MRLSFVTIPPRRRGEWANAGRARRALAPGVPKWMARRLLLADQQVAVATPHASDGVFDQPDDLRTIGRRQPVAPALGPHVWIKQGGGQIAVGRLLLMTVKRPQHQDHAAALLHGQGRDDRARCGIRQAVPELKDGFHAVRHVHIERDNGGDRN